MALKRLEHGDLCTEGLASHVPGCVGPTFTRNCINNEKSNKMIIWLLQRWLEKKSLNERKGSGGQMENHMKGSGRSFKEFLIFKDQPYIK